MIQDFLITFNKNKIQMLIVHIMINNQILIVIIMIKTVIAMVNIKTRIHTMIRVMIRVIHLTIVIHKECLNKIKKSVIFFKNMDVADTEITANFLMKSIKINFLKPNKKFALILEILGVANMEKNADFFIYKMKIIKNKTK